MGNTTSELQQATDEVQQEVEQEAAAAAQPEVRHSQTAGIRIDIIHAYTACSIASTCASKL
jgi:hypothetical protein